MLIDELRKAAQLKAVAGYPPGYLTPDMFFDLLAAEVVLADNVADYYYSSGQDHWPLEAFPNIAPPFPTMFVDWPVPKLIMPGEQTVAAQNLRCGLLIHSFEADQSDPEIRNLRETCPVGFSEPKWICESLLFSKVGKQLLLPGYSTVWYVTAEGTMAAPAVRLSFGPMVQEPEIQEYLQLHAARNLHVPFLALSFLHCKNVTIRKVTPPSPWKNAKVAARHPPTTTYSVLEIKPMQRVLATEGRSGVSGVQRALHICRGHFKDFSKGGGLFGRYKGVYWWDMQTRGNPAAGIRVKDYELGKE